VEPARTRRRPAASVPATKPGEDENKGPSLEKAFDQVVETLEAITQEREADEPIWGSMIKQAIKRRNPGFNERAYGFRSFNDMLLEAQKRGLLKLEADEKSGGYRVQAVD
jgi:hypothetical protein